MVPGWTEREARALRQQRRDDLCSETTTRGFGSCVRPLHIRERFASHPMIDPISRFRSSARNVVAANAVGAVATSGRAPLDRRESLKVLAASAFVAAAARPHAVDAKKGGKNGGNNRRGKGRKRCQRQEGQCRQSIEEFCARTARPAECVEDFGPCCEPLARCQASASLECLFRTEGG